MNASVGLVTSVSGSVVCAGSGVLCGHSGRTVCCAIPEVETIARARTEIESEVSARYLIRIIVSQEDLREACGSDVPHRNPPAHMLPACAMGQEAAMQRLSKRLVMGVVLGGIC